MAWRVWSVLAAFMILMPGFVRADIWTPDPAKAGWGEDEIYSAYAKWVNQIPDDQLQNAYDRMKEIARRNPSGGMAAMLKAQIWDCSSTAIYIWARFCYENRLPMLMPVYQAGPDGRSGKVVTYSHASKDWEGVADREDRFLHFVKVLQNMTFVHDLSSDLTYPIKLSALQGGVVNLSKTHTRVIAGVERNDPENHPLLVTGQWIYTTKWAASTAFAQLEAHQQSVGELGLRLFRVTIKDGDGYRLKPAEEHKRFGGTEQMDAKDNFRAAVFRANGVPYRDSLLLKHADTIFREWMEYRNLYIRTHPYPEYSHEHATTQANDQRIVRLYEEMVDVERRPDVIADLGPNYLTRKSFPIEFTDFKGWKSTGNVTIRLFGETFKRYQPRLSEPTNPVSQRTLTMQDFLNQSIATGATVNIKDFVELVKGSGQKINLRENRVWIRRMSPEAQMELMPYLEF